MIAICVDRTQHHADAREGAMDLEGHVAARTVIMPRVSYGVVRRGGA